MLSKVRAGYKDLNLVVYLKTHMVFFLYFIKHFWDFFSNTKTC